MPAPETLNVAIVGCGLIGAAWDQPGSAPFALTHAGAFSKNPGCRVVAFCDRDLDKAAQAVARWNCGQAFDDVAAMLAAVRVDVLVVATASSVRWSVIEPALAAGVKTLVLEKPLATTLDESERIVAAMEAAGARALVNFSRRWDPAMDALRTRIAMGEFGHIQRLVGYYGKGIVNNASHMIDLAANLTGAVPVRARALGSPLPPGESAWSAGADPAVDAQVEFEGSNGHRFQLTLLGSDQSAFTLFALRILGADAYCDIDLGGRRITLTKVVDDPNFAGYRIPGSATEEEAGYLRAMEAMAAEALQLAAGNIPAARCDGAAALRTARTVEAIRSSAAANKDGAWVDLAFA